MISVNWICLPHPESGLWSFPPGLLLAQSSSDFQKWISSVFETLFFSNYLIQLLRTVEKEANDRLESRLWREGHCAFNNSPLSRLTKTLFEPWIVHFNSSETQKNRTRLCNKITDDHFYYFIGIFWWLEKVSKGLIGTVNKFFHSAEVTWSVSFDRHVTTVHLKFDSV